MKTLEKMKSLHSAQTIVFTPVKIKKGVIDSFTIYAGKSGKNQAGCCGK